MQRYDLEQVNACYTTDHEMVRSDDGEWVRYEDAEASALELLAALKSAEVFIRNGIELGFIRMPDDDCPDTAKAVPGIVRAAIAKAEGRS